MAGHVRGVVGVMVGMVHCLERRRFRFVALFRCWRKINLGARQSGEFVLTDICIYKSNLTRVICVTLIPSPALC